MNARYTILTIDDLGSPAAEFLAFGPKVERFAKGPPTARLELAELGRDEVRKLREHPRVVGSAEDVLAPECFSMAGLRELYREMLNAWDERGEVVPGALLSHVSGEARTELERVLEHIKIPADLGAGVAEEEEKRLIAEIQKLGAQHAPGNPADKLEVLRQKKGRKSGKRA